MNLNLIKNYSNQISMASYVVTSEALRMCVSNLTRVAARQNAVAGN